MRKNYLASIIGLFAFSFMSAQEEGAQDLANKIQNPVADLISLPFQNNTDFGDDNTNTLNIQPVLPFKISESWNLVTRTIVPIMSAPTIHDNNVTGIGNITLSALFTPSKPSSFIWAVGPSFMFPTVKENLGYDKLGLAPTFAMIYQANGMTYGGIFQNFFDVAGPSDAGDINLFYSQIFITKNLSKGWYINTAPIITANWEANSDQRWTVPLGAGFGKLFALGKLPINSQIGMYKYVEHPSDADWQLRVQVTLLFPK
ncbi:neuromedin U [Flavobacterium chuncheonense]|uniref:Neuromedin U n=1 Tax=Flavobacterium chuncheonense TaxID=2026653 RepID=A0ABW5YI97_9FLAO